MSVLGSIWRALVYDAASFGAVTHGYPVLDDFGSDADSEVGNQ